MLICVSKYRAKQKQRSKRNNKKEDKIEVSNTAVCIALNVVKSVHITKLGFNIAAKIEIRNI